MATYIKNILPLLVLLVVSAGVVVAFPENASAAASCPALTSTNFNAVSGGAVVGSFIGSVSCQTPCQDYSNSIGQAVVCSAVGETQCLWEWCDPYYGCGCAQYQDYTTCYAATSQSSGTGYSAQCTYTPSPPTLSFSVSPGTITQGGSATLSWSSTGASSCSASDAWSGSKQLSGSQVVSPSSTGTYTLTCTNPGGSATESRTVTVLPPPSATLNVSQSSVYLGQSVTLSWAGANATSCTGSGFSTGNATNGSINMTMNTLGNITFSVSCTNAVGSTASANRTVTVSAAPGSSCEAGMGVQPSTTTVFSGNFYTQIEQNSSYWNALVADTQANGGVTPTYNNDGWYANKATADRICAVLFPGSYNGGYGADDFATPGGHYIMVWNGSSWQKPNAASGWNSHLTGNFTCLQNNPAPAAMKLPSSPTAIATAQYTEWYDPWYGGGSSGSGVWCTSECTQYAAANGINGTYYCGQKIDATVVSTPVCYPDPNGQPLCADSSYSSYTQTCYVGGSPVSATWNEYNPSTKTWAVSCTYTQPPVSISSFTASPTSVNAGGSSTLTWSSSNATSCTGANFSTSDATSGSVSVSPGSSTTYSVTCTGPGGSASQSATVTVTIPNSPPATPTFTACPATLTTGQVGTFTLNTTDPNGDTINYWFDQDNNLTADQSYGYVPSNTPHSFTHSFASPGSYTVNGRANDLPGATSSWTPCNVAVSAPGQPNLVPHASGVGSFNPNPPVAGSPTYMYQTVQNFGNAAASNFANVIEIQGVGRVLQYNAPLSIPASNYDTYGVVYTFPSAGTYTIRGCVDMNVSGAGSVTESNEGDNCGAWTAITVYPVLTASCSVSPATANTGQSVTWTAVPAGGTGSYTYIWSGTDSLSGSTISVNKTYSTTGVKTASVTITSGSQSQNNVACSNSVSISLPPQPNLTTGNVSPTTATVNVALNLSATVTNSGNLTTGAGFTNVFQHATDASGTGATVIGTDTSPTLTTSATDATTISYTFTTLNGSNPWYVRACADNDAVFAGTIPESNEGDNCGTWTPITVSYPTLTASCGASPTSATTAQTVTWTAVPTGGTGSYTYSWSGTDSLSGSTISVNKSYSTTGSKTASVTVTSGSQNVSISCHTDSTPGDGTVTVTPATQPNLTAGAITPVTGIYGVPLTLSSTVSNVGTASTGAGFTNLFQAASTSAGTGAVDIGTYVRSSALTNGSNFAATRTYVFTTSATHYIRACADKSSSANPGTITESDENDNCGAWTAVVIGNNVDLNGTGLSISGSTTTRSFHGSIQNLTAVAATTTTFANRFQIDLDSSSGTFTANTNINTGNMAGINGGETKGVPSQMWTAVVGTHRVRLCADYNNTIKPEANESNQCTSATTFTVSTFQPDVTAGAVSPTAAIVGTAVTLQATVDNVGSATTGAGFMNLFQRANDSSGTGAIDIGTFNRTTALNLGSNFVASLSYTFSAPPSGNSWWVRACADKDTAGDSGDITESNEGNNCGAWTQVTMSTPQCADGINNDPAEDSLIDTLDYGCTDASDNTESPNSQCSDLADNDSDGRTDTLDYGCTGPTDTTESPNPQCSDGANNDGDSYGADYPNDPGCINYTDITESPNPECSDGIDNDSDGNIDAADFGCSGGPTDETEGTSSALSSLAVTTATGSPFVQKGNTATLTWSGTSALSCAITSSKGYDSGNLSGSLDGTPHTFTTPAVDAQTDFTLTCLNDEGTPTSTTVTVFITPDTGEI